MAFEMVLKLACKNPETVKVSLEPDIKNDKISQTEIVPHCETKTNKNFVEIKIKSKKLSHLKAIVNSYLNAVAMLNEVEKMIE